MVINSPSAAYMRYWTGLSLVQVMACRLVGANLLQWLINLVGGQLCDMAYIVPMHVKPKFTYLLTGGRLNKKDGLTRYGNSHVKDKTS